ncbi:DUF4012 domain-containing protein [Microbacterium kyungheense]|uniref:Uncharacterized protein DUF4012 n=1 Tax=Microbacterium kyungheense TaxID=1263636 RepID=A0A543F321_9MICO|nr:DUF4012 domain-containing protein [Microbacterium kyungheense]TQM28227.1 uncharacterized protein DUF4012 [Microbacterium kyungheense]
MTPPDSPTSGDIGRKRKTRRNILLVLTGALVALVGATAWVGIRAVLLKSELEAMLPVASRIEEAVGTRDLSGLGDLVGNLRGHAAQAEALSGDPIWRIAELIPGLGADLTAARVVSSSLHDIATAAGPLVDVLATANTAGASGLDLELLARLGGPLQQTSTAFSAAETDLARLDTSVLVPQLASGVERLSATVSAAAQPIATITPAVRALPSMLGADGPSNLLVMLQNNAELRTGGGITGAFAMLRSDHGTVTLVDQTDPGEFPGLPQPIAAVPESTTELFGDQFARFVQNTSMTPDFALTADLVSAWWKTRSDQAPDAIVSLDMPAVAALLKATGPVQLPAGELTADNFLQVMLQDVYTALDRDEQTAFQQQVTAAVFASALSGDVDALGLMEALADPVDDGRVSLWSADPDIEELLRESAYGGPSARQADAEPGAFAVYFNDATTGKMGPFLDVALGIGRAECRSDGLTDAVVTVTLTNTAAADAGTTLPWWVSGGGIEGVPPGDIATSVSVAAPTDSFFAGVSIDGEQLPSTDVKDAGYPTSAVTVTVHPGETKTIEYRFTLELDQGLVPSLLHTPLITDPEIVVTNPSCG